METPLYNRPVGRGPRAFASGAHTDGAFARVGGVAPEGLEEWRATNRSAAMRSRVESCQAPLADRGAWDFPCRRRRRQSLDQLRKVVDELLIYSRTGNIHLVFFIDHLPIECHPSYVRCFFLFPMYLALEAVSVLRIGG